MHSARFLELVSSGMTVARAAYEVGITSKTLYARAARSPEFKRQWDLARLRARQNIADTVMDKALVLTGRIVEEPLLDPNTGEPVLDENFEVVTTRRLEDYDSKILAKLIDRFVPSEDGASNTNVAVQTNVALALASGRPEKQPRLVHPS